MAAAAAAAAATAPGEGEAEAEAAAGERCCMGTDGRTAAGSEPPAWRRERRGFAREVGAEEEVAGARGVWGSMPEGRRERNRKLFGFLFWINSAQ
jgi:hypothetical protein